MNVSVRAVCFLLLVGVMHCSGAESFREICRDVPYREGDLINYEMISVEKDGKLRLLSDRMGCLQEDNPSVYTELSPLENLSETFPPVLIFHGDQDQVVHLEHSLRFKQKADQLGVSCTLQVVRGAGHGFKVKPKFKECRFNCGRVRPLFNGSSGRLEIMGVCECAMSRAVLCRLQRHP